MKCAKKNNCYVDNKYYILKTIKTPDKVRWIYSFERICRINILFRELKDGWKYLQCKYIFCTIKMTKIIEKSNVSK